MKGWVAGLIAISVLAGCGGSADRSGDQSTSKSESARRPPTATTDRGGKPDSGGGEEGDQQGLSAIPAADRHAFVQLGVAISELNTGASLLLVKGLERPIDRVVLRRVRPHVAALRPRDLRLRRLRLQVLRALDHAIRVRRNRHLSHGAAVALTAEARSALKLLKSYERVRPAIGGLVPD